MAHLVSHRAERDRVRLNDNFTYAWSTVPQEILSGKDIVTPDRVATIQSTGQNLTIIVSMFMHGGFAHILGNMLFLGVLVAYLLLFRERECGCFWPGA